MRLTKGVLALLVLLVTASLSATTVDIGYLTIVGSYADYPGTGNQTVQFFNETGGNCSSTYVVCNNLQVTDWTLVVDYSDAGGTHQQTFTATASDGIDPDSGGGYTGQAAMPWSFSLNCTDSLCSSFDTTITGITFSGRIGSTDPTILNDLSGSPGTSFYASPTFTAQYAPNIIFAGSNFVLFDSADILVNSSSGPVSNVPEPSGLVLSVCGIGALAAKFTRRGAIR